MRVCDYINCHKASIGKTMKVFKSNDDYLVVLLHTCDDKLHYQKAHETEPIREDMEKYFTWDKKDEKKLFTKPKDRELQFSVSPNGVI